MEILEQFLKLLKDWIDLLAPFSIVGGLIWKFWLQGRFKEIKELYRKINLISEEFRPNGGSTLRDAINRIEDKITLQEQKTSAIIKSFPIGTWISDEKGKCIDVNKNLCQIMGRTESEIKGDNWSNWVHQDEKEEVFDEWTRCIQNDLNFDMGYRFVLPNRKIQKVHGTAYRLKNDDGQIVGFLGTLEAIGPPE